MTITVCITAIPSRLHMLERAFRSVTAQTLPPNEIIVELDVNRRGAPFMRTRALKRASSSRVAFLDDDDEMLPFHLEHLSTKMDETGADMVFPWFDVVGGTDPFPDKWDKEWDRESPHQTTITTLVKREPALAVGGFMDPDFVADDPGTDEGGNRAGEDFRFVCRLYDAGYKIVHLSERTWLWHHHGRNTMGLPSRW